LHQSAKLTTIAGIGFSKLTKFSAKEGNRRKGLDTFIIIEYS